MYILSETAGVVATLISITSNILEDDLSQTDQKEESWYTCGLCNMQNISYGRRLVEHFADPNLFVIHLKANRERDDREMKAKHNTKEINKDEVENEEDSHELGRKAKHCK
jgi:hypothetical protein